MAEIPPPLNAPTSSTTVRVSAIDSTLALSGMQRKFMWGPDIPGFSDEPLSCGTWSFLIEHPSGRKLIYDLGLRKDWRNLSPNLGLADLVDGGVAQFHADKNVADILQDGGLDLQSVEGIIWSHWHFDHTGDPSTFPPCTKLIVGEGFKRVFTPAYPTDPTSPLLESDFANRELLEIDFTTAETHIGRFKAFDYFGDGSFYLLDSPGHAVGHIDALARTHPSPSPGFIHLAGDAVHHAAEFRPSKWLPLPESIQPSPVPQIHASACPGHFFDPIFTREDQSKNEHMLELRDPSAQEHQDQKASLIYDEPQLRDTVRKVEELDADSDVFTIFAHDWSLKGVLHEWPQALNEWKRMDWRETTRWKFLEDFEKACR